MVVGFDSQLTIHEIQFKELQKLNLRRKLSKVIEKGKFLKQFQNKVLYSQKETA